MSHCIAPLSGCPSQVAVGEGDGVHGMGCIMRRGASGKQYLFLHISCLILQSEAMVGVA
ncbi:hypothetical protein [Pandoraea sputorum]